MATLTIRNLDDSIKDKIRIMAAHHNRSMESEVRSILKHSVSMPQNNQAQKFGQQITQLFKETPIELSLSNRSLPKDPPTF